MKFEEWKHDLQMRLAAYLKRPRRKRRSRLPESTPLETSRELHMYVAGVAAAFHIFLGRGVTDSEVEQTLDFHDYYGAAWLTLNSLEDWDVLKSAPRERDGEIEFPLKGGIVISERLRQNHNHSICCPGCDDCPNLIRKTASK